MSNLADEEGRAAAARAQQIRRIAQRRAQAIALRGSRLKRVTLERNWRPIRDMITDRKRQDAPGGGDATDPFPSRWRQ